MRREGAAQDAVTGVRRIAVVGLEADVDLGVVAEPHPRRDREPAVTGVVEGAEGDHPALLEVEQPHLVEAVGLRRTGRVEPPGRG